MIEATYNQNFGNFTVNCNEYGREIDAKTSGRAGALYMAKTRVDASTYKKQVVEVIEATALEETLSGQEPRQGRYGPFWTFGSDDDDFM